MSDESTRTTQGEQTETTDRTPPVSRRQAMGALGAAGKPGLAAASTSVSADHAGDGTATTEPASVIPNPNFITNARGEAPPFDDDTLVFDPAPVSIPLDELLDGDEEYDSELFRSLNDGKQQVVRPPEGYDRAAGYEESWVPMTWGEYSDVSGEVTVGEAYDDAGTDVRVTVEDGIPNGQYTVWVVKFAALAADSDLDPDDPFVTRPATGWSAFTTWARSSADGATPRTPSRSTETATEPCTR